jgi:hypothetical protein
MRIEASLITIMTFLLLNGSANAIEWKQLPFVPLNPASNLSDVANPITSRFNLSAAASGINSDITSLTALNSVAVSGNTQASTTTDFGAYINVTNNSALTAPDLYHISAPSNEYFVDEYRAVLDNEIGTTVQSLQGYAAYSFNNNPWYNTPGSSNVNHHDVVGFFAVNYNAYAGAYSWGINTACSDKYTTIVGGVYSHVPATCLGYELDFGVFDSGSTDNGIGIIISGNQQPIGAQAISISSFDSITTQWIEGLNIGSGAISNTGYGILMGSQLAPNFGNSNSYITVSIISGGSGYGANVTGTMTWNGGGCSINPQLSVTTLSSGVIGYVSIISQGICTTLLSNAGSWTVSGGLSGIGQGAIFNLSTGYVELGFGSPSITSAYAVFDQYGQLFPEAAYPIINNGTSGCTSGIFNISGGTLGAGYVSQVSITAVGGIITNITDYTSGDYSIPPTNPVSVVGTTCSTTPTFTATWESVGHYVTSYAYASGNGAIFRIIDQTSAGGFDFSLSGGNPAIYAVSAGASANLILNAKGNGKIISNSLFSGGSNQTALSIFNTQVFGFRAPSYTYTDSDITGPLGPYGFVSNSEFDSPTFASVSIPLTITNAQTVYIAGPPIAGTNVTFTNSWALNVNGSVKALNLNLGTLQSGPLLFSSLIPIFRTPSFTDTDTSGTGTIALLNEVQFDPPNFASTNAMTVTNASTLYISGPPTAVANVTLTNKWAAWFNGATKVASLNISAFTGGILEAGSTGTISTDTTGISCTGTPTSSFHTNAFGIVTHC